MDQPAYAEKDRLNTGSGLRAHLIVPCLSSVLAASRGLTVSNRPLLYALQAGSTAIRYVTLFGTQARRRNRASNSQDRTEGAFARPLQSAGNSTAQ